MEEKPCLILTIGLPRSGKSTWARNSGYPIVNPDSIRLALHGQTFVPEAEPVVWAIAKVMVAALFRSGHSPVVLDACNTTEKRRADWRDPRWQCAYREFRTSKEECIRRAVASGREDILPVIERMAEQMEWVGHPDDGMQERSDA